MIAEALLVLAAIDRAADHAAPFGVVVLIAAVGALAYVAVKRLSDRGDDR